MRFRRAGSFPTGLLPTGRLALAFPFAIALTLLPACSAAPKSTTDGQGGSTGQGGQGNGGSGAAASSGGGGNQGGQGGQGGSISVGNGGQGGVGGSCAAVSSEAKAQLQPADIVIVVDTSGSMSEESAQVQQNLNEFASIITNSGIDVHVVLIADNTVCIPAPLGSGQCGGGDEKLPGYRHVLQTVASTDALQLIVSTYPQWKDALRPGATKTIAVVSDDDSQIGAGEFTNQLLALDPPTFQGFKFDGIVSSTSADSCIFGGCFFNCATCQNPCCDKAMFCTPLAAEEGTVYKELVNQTMGVFGDLCLQNFAPVFQDMATGIVTSAQLSCDYAIPQPPAGETLDPNKVNVNYTPSGQPATPILNVKTPGDCGAKGGWFYDNPNAPSKIVMCPGTCDMLKADANGKIEVLFGCETQIKPPE